MVNDILTPLCQLLHVLNFTSLQKWACVNNVYMHVYTDFCKCFFQLFGFLPDVHWMVDAWVFFSYIQRRPILCKMLATISHNSPNIFLTADDASVTISFIVTPLSYKYLMARLTASLSILEECNETSRLSTVSIWCYSLGSHICHLLLMILFCYDNPQWLFPWV